MASKKPKRYWKSTQERDADEAYQLAAQDEFSEVPDTGAPSLNRRGFLKAAGFTFAGAMVTGCSRAPVQKAIPFLIQPEEIVPGRAYHYASTCGACPAGCGLLVKNRDGRPIKLEGNPDHPISLGGLCAVGQASILGLYDSQRLKGPLHNGKTTDWNAIDAAIIEKLASIRSNGGAVRFLTGVVTSPTTKNFIDRFLHQFADGRHVIHESFSCSAIVDAHERTHGVHVLPHYIFERAEVIVSFDADFLGTWISPVEFTAAYRAGRELDGEQARFSRHVQFESRLSLTGAKADQRVRLAPRELGLVMTQLASLVARHAGTTFAADASASPLPAAKLQELADQLWQDRGHSLIVCGSQDVATQVICNFLNHILGNYGTTLDIEQPSRQGQGRDADVRALVGELADGKVAALFIHGVNPVFDLPEGQAIAETIQQVPLVVSFAVRRDETAAVAQFVCPDHHYLESWSDVEAVQGVVSFRQPVIAPLGETRSILESLSMWMGTPRSAYDILREAWPDEAAWERTVHDGHTLVSRKPQSVQPFQAAAVHPIAKSEPAAQGSFSLVLYPKVGMLDGRHAYNPWLHELPDPISKAVWDNYACLSPTAARRVGVEQGDVVRITGAAGPASAIELPVLIQLGQHDDVVAVALGYGSELSRRFAEIGPKWIHRRLSVGTNDRVGTNAAPLLSYRDDSLVLSGAEVRLSPAGRSHGLALTQDHHTITVPKHLAIKGFERRPNIQETSLAALHDPASTQPHGNEPHEDLWPADHPYKGHHWGMAIDLSSCTGCAACVIACQVENNIPVVGKDEVRRNREMHWIRIDRYYSDNVDDVDVVHQPMMCHHCDYAPCETVCPVLATVHSKEGLNQQVYNRCVGTRYCSNNCPYKVRRFNWFNYPRNDALANMMLNPDITIRSRGVMEKCSFCVQRIQEAKIEAKRRGVELADGDIQPACQQSCPAGAIVFGDMNDPDSAVSKLIRSGRHFRVLEDLNVRPSVGYLKLVRNRSEAKGADGHG